ncbi:DUF6443 domain-containing protein [Chryseobacterium sp. JV558]|uniref:DUF6443 domain-containing protein n=1 Tax=Chryseobacterium sp. JV558 TaxID=2663236 RepID=UPI00299E2B54|nr:DUF6443 domain-containing protein [Chryseobacterium sp. JV558]MDW9381783.1 RHS repeat-associated core domain-containing protein [Chryseobacterium sp. JV558]
MKKLIIPIGILIMGTAKSQLTSTENYVYSKTYLSDPTLTNVKTSETVQYFDGLGRPKQIVNVKASPLGRDVVTPIKYDQFGRQVQDYLPVPQAGTLNGAITPDPLSNVTSTPYGTEKIYSEKFLENSPLDRILSQKQVGSAWDNKPVQFGYDANADGEVKKYTATFSYTNFESKLILSGSYGTGQLYKNTVTDEDGNSTIEFKNGQGQVVLVRKVISATENADTYYVYNDYNQLSYVIPPKASVEADPNTVLNDLCYQYKYDGRNRLVEKRLPGKGWEYMVYNKADQLILTQDTVLKDKGQWLFTKYDQFGRVIYTGMTNNPASRASMQNSVNANANLYETRTVTPGFTLNGLPVNYTKLSTPTGVTQVLSVNYYDNYPAYSFNPAFPSTIQGEPVLSGTPTADGRSTKGLPVMSFVKNIEDDNWTKNYTYYDQKGRAIGSHSINHLGGYTHTESKLDFAGVTKQTVTKHKRLGTDTERIITETFDYDNQNRLLVHKHQVDSNLVEYLTQNKYNEISQLESKKVGGIAAASPLQQMDYKYNIRGWMTQINDPANLNGKLFGYKVKYTNPVYSDISPGKYNGNIAEIDWNMSTVNNLKRYNYTYDKLNRLTDAEYAEPETTNPHNKNFDERLIYDANGNIAFLKRNAIPVYGATATQVDNLEYKYTGNRLNQIIESSLNDSGYEGGNNIIDYDLNGNMITMKDKGIQTIQYNYLSLPDSYTITQNNPFGLPMNSGLEYLYRADGVKLRKTYSIAPPRGQTTITMTDYLDGFQYSYREGDGICLECRTETAFEEQAYKNINTISGIGGTPVWKLDFVPTPEGFYSFTENRYIYQYKDHLGNARVSFAKSSEGALEVTDTNNYYPFGLNHIEGLLSTSNFGGYYSYKYNGKELQETGMYDYGARFYMPDIGRWGVVDPLAETSRRWSPYTYAYNNPIRFIDPDGRQNKDITIPSGTDQKGIDAIMANLQKLTRDKLTTVKGVNGKTHVLIEEFEKNGKFENGTQLIRDLITDEHNVDIRIGKSSFATAKNKELASNGVGTDSEITFNPTGKQDMRVFGEDGNTMYETAPNFIVLGHELIHVKDHFSGTLNKTEAEHSYSDLKGIRLIETHPKSEFRASGFPGFVGKDGYSENKIRKEHKLKLRASYEVFTGRTR